jgi:hypothetical protein
MGIRSPKQGPVVQCLFVLRITAWLIIEDQPMSCMAASFELLDTHQRLCSPTNSARAKTDAPGSGQRKASMGWQ